MPTTALAEPCNTEPTNLTVNTAPTVMQAHLTCNTAICLQRRAALHLLVAERRYVLDRR